jgi:hypothetical protein
MMGMFSLVPASAGTLKRKYLNLPPISFPLGGPQANNPLTTSSKRSWAGRENCRSLGFARDDKGESNAHVGSRYRGMGSAAAGYPPIASRWVGVADGNGTSAAIIPLKPKDGLNGAPGICARDRRTAKNERDVAHPSFVRGPGRRGKNIGRDLDRAPMKGNRS